MTTKAIYSELEKVLKDINQWVKIDDEEEKKNNVLINAVCTSIIHQLKRDELFKFLFQDPVYTGSYYKGLKIQNPDEYDINLVLVLPKEMRQQCQMDTVAYPGTTKLNLSYKKVSQNKEMIEKIMTKLCKDDYLDCSKVNAWFEGLIQKALNMYPDGYYEGNKIKLKKSGPAKTLKINDCICLDLVSCFEFDLDLNPLPNYKQSELNKYRKIDDPNIIPCYKYVLVPKISYDRIPECPELYWRVSFPKQEQQCLNNLDKLKPAVRLLKLIRDDKTLNLCSYFIQTVAMHQADEIRSSKRYPCWTLGETFLHLLECLIECVSKGKIPFFWLEDFNLLANWSVENLNNLENFLRNMYKKILQDPKNFFINNYISKKRVHKSNPRENQVTDDAEPDFPSSFSSHSGLINSRYPRVQEDQSLINREVSSLSSSLEYLGIAAGTIAAIGAIALGFINRRDK